MIRLIALCTLCLLPIRLLAVEPEYLPKDNQVTGWARSASVKTFERRDLYGHINGGAEIFLELGFEKLQVQRFKKQGDEIAVEVYRMADQVGANGIYWLKCGKETRNKELNEIHTLGRYQLTMQKNRFFVLINNLSGKQELVHDLVIFAKAIAAKIPESSKLSVTSLLPADKRVEGSLRVIRGPFSLNLVYTFGEGDLLLLGNKTTGISARYADPKGDEFTRIAVVYPSVESAAKGYKNLINNLDSYIKVVSQSDNRLVFVDFAKKYGEIILQGNRLDISVRLPLAPSQLRKVR
jgi:uncharacterized protein DUF6599